MLLHRHELTESWKFEYIRQIVQNTMDPSNEHPSQELQSMSSIAHNLMLQLVTATAQADEQRRSLLQMETQLLLLREQIQEASSVGSSAAPRKVVQVNKETMTDSLKKDQKRTMTDPLPELNPVPVLNAVAYVISQEDELHTKTCTPVDVTTDDVPSAGASAEASASKPKKSNAWLNFCTFIRKDSAHMEQIKKLSLSQKSKYMSAVWQTLPKDSQLAFKADDPMGWHALPAVDLDILANILKDERPLDEQTFPNTLSGKKRPHAGAADVVQGERPTTKSRFIVFQEKLFHDDEFKQYKNELQRLKVGTPERGALISKLYNAYLNGSLSTAAAASAGNEASAGKEKMDTDSDEENEEHQLHEGFDWTRDAIFHELGLVYPFFKEDLLDAKSLWYVDQLTTCRPDFLGQWATNKQASFKYMLKTRLITMDGLNEHIQGHWSKLLSEPCCWKIKRPLESPAKDGKTFKVVEEWHPQVKNAMMKWESQIKTSSRSDFLGRFDEDSALHKCTMADFMKVKKLVDDKITNTEITEWNDFATELLLLCKKQPGNGIIRDQTKVHNNTLLAQIVGEFVPDSQIAHDRA